MVAIIGALVCFLLAGLNVFMAFLNYPHGYLGVTAFNIAVAVFCFGCGIANSIMATRCNHY